MKFFFSYFSHLPSFDQSKDRYKSKGHQASVFPMFIKILFCLLLQLPLQSPALSTEQQEEGMEYILAHASLYITLKPKDDLQMKVNIDSPVQFFTLFSCLLPMEVDLSCSQPSSCPVICSKLMVITIMHEVSTCCLKT